MGVFSSKPGQKERPREKPRPAEEQFDVGLYFPTSITYRPKSKAPKNYPCRRSGCAKTHKTAVARLAHEHSHGPLALPPGVRIVNRPVTHGRLDRNASLRFIQHINSLPIYFINAHSCVPIAGYAVDGEILTTSLTLTKNTYMISMVQPGEGCSSNVDHLLEEHTEDFRRLLYLHGPDDFAPSREVGHTRFSLFAGFQRAVGPRTPYPNIAFTLNNVAEDGRVLPRNQNPYGVYDLSRAQSRTNEHSIIPQDAKRRNWTLHDIIQDVYRATGLHQGIFINGGCLTACSPTNTPIESYTREIIAATEDSMRAAGMMMQAAEAAYKTSNPVLTAGELVAVGMSRPAEPISQYPADRYYLTPANRELYAEGLTQKMPLRFATNYPSVSGGGTRKRR